MAAVAGVRLPELQLRHGDLPLQQRPFRSGLRRRRLRRAHRALPLPPPAGARPRWPRPGVAEGGGVGALHAPHAHVLLQGRRHHADLGRRGRLGDGGWHHRRRLLRLLRAPRGPLDDDDDDGDGNFCGDGAMVDLGAVPFCLSYQSVAHIPSFNSKRRVVLKH